MGEVYQAKDEKLGRQVAIKVLPEEFAQDTDRVARFRREAQLLASLNHPNIAAIHGLEETDGKHFLVLELVEGPTLEDRIKQGAIPVEESLKLALQIAEALEAAHEKGVIHRDLKPANIKVTPDGKVKVLDFGLAKAFEGDQADVSVSNSPTLSMAATQQGIILGTAAYMSPEQARGENADQRADVWAFGVVLFEMLTGRGTFDGKTVSDVLASVLKIDPDWNALPLNLHPRLRQLLERCLEKEAQDRYHGIADARVDIRKVLADPSGVIVRPVTQIVQTVPQSKVPLVAAVVLAMIVGGLVWVLRPAPEQGRVSRFSYVVPEEHIFRNAGRAVFALSPDGSSFVYNSTQGLYLRRMDELEAQLISGTVAGARNPFFSPDGQWVGFEWGGKLQKIAVSGGTPVEVCSARVLWGASWGLDDMILFGQADGIWHVSANGGTPELIIGQEGGEQFDGPQLLRDQWILFTVSTGGGWDNAQIVVQSLESGERKTVWTGSDARYVPTGHLVYALDNDLFAVPFDLDELEVTGGAVALVDGVSRAAQTASANYGISRDGSLVYLTGPASLTATSMRWVDREGNVESVGGEARNYVYPKISPDGNRVAIDVRDPQADDIVVWDFTRATLTRLTTTEESELYPVWTPDSERIAYGKPIGVFWKAADGSGVEERISERAALPYFFTLSGRELIVRAVDANGTLGIGMISTDGSEDIEWLLDSEFDEINAELSPDGHWMAYQSNESGRDEIYVRPFPNVDDERRPVSNAGGTAPVWAKDGEELFYFETEPLVRRLMAVPVQTGSTVTFGSPDALFEFSYVQGPPGRSYDVSSDGQRFLIVGLVTEGSEDTPSSRIVTVLNWFEELKQRVPVP